MATENAKVTLDNPSLMQDLAARALKARRVRAAVKATLRAAPTGVESRRLAADVVEHPDPLCRAWPVSTALLACRQVGPHDMRRLLATIGASELLTLGAMTDRQRRVLAGVLRDRRRP